MLGLIARSSAALALVLALVPALGACKQAEGEACQVNDDCEDTLTCSEVTSTCVRGTGGDDDDDDTFPTDSGIDGAAIDARPPIDAPPTIDSSVVDAPTDAPADAPAN